MLALGVTSGLGAPCRRGRCGWVHARSVHPCVCRLFRSNPQAAAQDSVAVDVVAVRQAHDTAELRAGAYLRASIFYHYPEGRSEYTQRVSSAHFRLGQRVCNVVPSVRSGQVQSFEFTCSRCPLGGPCCARPYLPDKSSITCTCAES